MYHVNVHSCPLGDTANGLCGPWISPSGSIFTHSDVIGKNGPGDFGNQAAFGAVAKLVLFNAVVTGIFKNTNSATKLKCCLNTNAILLMKLSL